MARQETEAWDPTKQSFKPPKTPEEFNENLIGLAKFLDGDPVHFADIQNVIPSNRLGVMYTIDVVRFVEDEYEDVTTETFRTNSKSVNDLFKAIELKSDKEREDLKMVSDNLGFIRESARNPLTWIEFFNPAGDN